VAQFKRGDFSTCVAPRSGRPKTVTTPEIIEEELVQFSMFHRAFFNSIIDKHQRMHFFTFKTVLV